MSKAQDLLEEWTSGARNGLRPQRVQRVRDDLMEVTGQSIPRRIPEIEAFLDNQQLRGVITRKLREAVEDSAEGSDEE
jgi:hypothetical protein